MLLWFNYINFYWKDYPSSHEMVQSEQCENEEITTKIALNTKQVI